MRKESVADLSAEFLGTMIILLFGCGVVAQVLTGGFPKTAGGGDHDSIAWAWGLGVTFGIYVAARISGAHLNPAVTLALAVFRGFSWRRVLPYWLAQTAGAFVGALIVRFVYADQLDNIDPGRTAITQGVFSTSPGTGVSIATAFADQVVGTAILVIVVLAVTTAVNNPPGANLGPLVIGLLVVGIGMAWGTNAGYAINPARDFGPRLVSWLTGYGNAWNAAGTDTLYFWLPIVAPMVGALVGGAIFRYLIDVHLPAEPEEITVAEPDTSSDPAHR